MNHDRAFKAFRPRGLSLQFERGELDAEFKAAEAPIAELRATVAERIRQLADAVEQQ